MENFIDFNYVIKDGLFILNSTNIITLIAINIFIFLFMLSTRKLIKKARFKASILNFILFLIAVFSSLMAVCDNFIISYLLLEINVILIYQYASNFRIKKKDIYNPDFITTSGIASILFVAFYLISLSIGEVKQLNIILICLSAAFLLKIGIFPIFNYILDKKYKTNIPYSILLYSYLPFLGVVVFNKMISLITLTNEIYRITMIVFLFFVMLYASIGAFKAKNFIKFLAYSMQFLTIISLYSILFLSSDFLGIQLSICALFLMLALYSLAIILKINLNLDKINISNLKGAFLNNKTYSFLLILSLLIMVGIIPSGLLSYIYDILSSIYLFDKYSIFIIFSMIAFDILILFNVFNIIETCFSSFNDALKPLTKRTALNYAVLFMIIICLIIDFLYRFFQL